MKKPTYRISTVILLCLILTLPAIASAQVQQRPPEWQEIMRVVQGAGAALSAETLRQLESIKAKYPESTIMDEIDSLISVVKILLCNTVEEVLDSQKTLFESTEGMDLLLMYNSSCSQILLHQKVDDFDPDKVVQAILHYADEGHALINDTHFLDSLEAPEKEWLESLAAALDMQVVNAYLYVENAENALEYLDKYRSSGGRPSGEYNFNLGQANEQLGNKQEAFEAFLSAAGANYRGADSKAKEIFLEGGGDLEEYDRLIEEKLSELPFHPEPFVLTDPWHGKTVLLELFTGSECPPCVAADLAFDGVIETYDPKYVAVLIYHLPIPGPDPMMNPATGMRQNYYEVRSTPSTFFDGEPRFSGGGSRDGAENKYNQYISAINPVILNVPKAQLEVSAILEDNTVRITWSSEDDLEAVNYNFALVQIQDNFRGGNGIITHPMVVRDFRTLTKEYVLTRGRNIDVTFDLFMAEKEAENSLKDLEVQRNYKFRELHHEIDRSQLKVFFFVQDREGKAVYNAVSTDVIIK